MPELRGAVARLGARALLLDGELCVVLPDGRTRFQALQDALAGGARDGIASFAFDLLHLDGEDVAALPLDERRSRLRALVPAGGVVRCADAFEGDGPDVWREACRLGLEGIVSKRRDLADRPGRSAAWQGTGGAEFGFEFVVEVAFGFEFVVEVAFEFEFEFAFGGRGRLRRPRLPSLPRRRSLHRRDELGLVRYYDAVAEAMLPHVAGRPLTLVHCPTGLAGACRYMKHSKVWAPDAVRRVRIQEKTKLGEYLVVDSREALFSIAQMDVVERGSSPRRTRSPGARRRSSSTTCGTTARTPPSPPSPPARAPGCRCRCRSPGTSSTAARRRRTTRAACRAGSSRCAAPTPGAPTPARGSA